MSADEAQKVAWNASTYIQIAAAVLVQQGHFTEEKAKIVSERLQDAVSVRRDEDDPAQVQSDAIVAGLAKLSEEGIISSDEHEAFARALIQAPQLARRLATMVKSDLPDSPGDVN